MLKKKTASPAIPWAVSLLLTTSCTTTQSLGDAVVQDSGYHPASRSGWIDPVPVPHMPPGFMARWPSATVHQDTIYVAANLWSSTPTSQWETKRDDVLLTRIPGAPFSPPPGEHILGYPSIQFDANDRMHLFWASPREPGPVDRRRFSSFNVLWHSILEHDTWTTPQRIVEAGRLSWDPERPVLLDRNTGHFHIIIPVSAPNGMPALAHIQGKGTSWTSQTLPVQATYADIAQTLDGTLAVTALGAIPSASGSAQALFLLRSTDGGSTWTPPRVLTAVGADHVRHLHLLRSPGGGLEVIWEHQSEEGEPQLRRMLADSSGADWTPAEPLPLPRGVITGIRPAVTACGRATAIVETLQTTVFLYQINWTRSGSTIEKLFSDQKAAAAPALITKGNVLRLLWSGVPPQDESMTFMIASRRDCDATGAPSGPGASTRKWTSGKGLQTGSLPGV